MRNFRTIGTIDWNNWNKGEFDKVCFISTVYMTEWRDVVKI